MSKQASFRLAFFAYAHNLAEVIRAVEIARELRRRGHEIHFFTHGGPHEEHILKDGFPLKTLVPVVTPQKHEHLIGVEQGRTFKPHFQARELAAYVESEKAALEEFQPHAAYLGMNIPLFVSARAARVPLIAALPAPVVAAWYENGLGSFPDSHENRLTRRLPQKWKDSFFNWAFPRMPMGVRAFNQVGGQYGLPPLNTLMEAFYCDLTLLTDIAEMTGLPESRLPQNCRYIGPLAPRVSLEFDPRVEEVFRRPGPNIFYSMGSSAHWKVFQTGARALMQGPCNLVIATTSIMDPQELGPLPPNVYSTRYVPLRQVLEAADLAVTHGGQGTAHGACMAGVPLVGVALQFEQQANLDMIQKAGMGVRIPLHHYNKKRILEEVERVLYDPGFAHNARRMQSLFQNVDAPANAAEAIVSFLTQR